MDPVTAALNAISAITSGVFGARQRKLELETAYQNRLTAATPQFLDLFSKEKRTDFTTPVIIGTMALLVLGVIFAITRKNNG